MGSYKWKLGTKKVQIPLIRRWNDNNDDKIDVRDSETKECVE